MRTQERAENPVIVGFESIYDSAVRDLQSEPERKKGQAVSSMKIFSYKDLGIELANKKLTLGQRLRNGWEEFKKTENIAAPLIRSLCWVECSDTLTLWERFWNACRATWETKPVYAGDIFAEINKKMRALGWRMGSLGDMLAHEATMANQHEYPLFAVGRFYEHSYSHGPLSSIGPSKIVPVITKAENGDKKLDQYDLYSEPFARGRKNNLAKILPEGYFIAVCSY